MATAFDSTDSFTPHSRHIAVVAAGLSDPSSTSMLGNQLSATVAEALSQRGHKAEVHYFELREVATDIAESMVTFTRSERLKDRKSTRLNSSHVAISYAVFCLKKKKLTTLPKESR